jgi:hypothetical protein
MVVRVRQYARDDAALFGHLHSLLGAQTLDLGNLALATVMAPYGCHTVLLNIADSL